MRDDETVAGSNTLLLVSDHGCATLGPKQAHPKRSACEIVVERRTISQNLKLSTSRSKLLYLTAGV